VPKITLQRSYDGWINLLAIAAAACCHVMSDAIGCFTLCSPRVSLTKLDINVLLVSNFLRANQIVCQSAMRYVTDLQGLLQLVSAVIIISINQSINRSLLYHRKIIVTQRVQAKLDKLVTSLSQLL